MSTEEVKALVEELRYGAEYGCDADLIERAAAAIEALQAEVQSYDGLRKRIKAAEVRLLLYKGEADLYKELYRSAHEAFLTELYGANKDMKSTEKILLDGCGAKMEVQNAGNL